MMNPSAFEIDFRIVTFVLVAMVVQLLICFKKKSLSSRLTPVILCFVVTVVFYLGARLVGGWYGLFRLLPVSFVSFWLLIGCGIGWAFWATFRNKGK